MKVKRLHLQNYGRFDDLNIDFAPTAEKTGNVTVIVGNNGAGKSQILQALATSFSWFVSKLVNDTDGFEIDKTLIKNGKNDVKVNILVDFDENNPRAYGPVEDAYWTVSNVKDGRISSFQSSTKELKKTIRSLRLNLTNKDKYSLPLTTFYTVDRTSLLKYQIDVNAKQFEQLEGYKDCLNYNSIDFSGFLQWFRNSEDIENEDLKMKFGYLDFLDEMNDTRLQLSQLLDDLDLLSTSTDSKINIEESKNKVNTNINTLTNYKNNLEKKYKISFKNLELDQKNKLNSVRKAINDFTGFQNLNIRRQGTPTMILEKNGEELDVNQLSQGEKSLLALVGDIARRLTLLNPSLDNPLEGKGVVMIDEVDLHLHPKWQHDLIDKLVATFPNVQFILTTHSPHVISDRADILVYSLDDGELTKMPNVYGEDVNTVLTKVFDVPIRDPKAQADFDKVAELIYQKNFESAENYIMKLEKQMPENLELLRCRLHLTQAQLAAKKEG